MKFSINISLLFLLNIYNIIKTFGFRTWKNDIKSLNEYLTPDEIRSLLKNTTTVRIIWSFWSSGTEHAHLWNQVNAITWHCALGPEWQIFVLSSLPNTPSYFRNFISDDLLPIGFDNIETWEAKSDLIRLALLKVYGGVWMDISNFLFESIDN
jgi:mannosyltransferase OCH1-like enzyme